MTSKESIPGITLWLFAAISLIVAACFSCDCPAQTPTPLPGPTPDPSEYSTVQEELSAWWAWCLRHPNSLMRVDKKYEVHTVNGTAIRQYMEKQKVVGAPPGRPPFASMIRFKTYEELRRDGVLRGLWNQGWTYQTSSSTSIGVGSFTKEVWGE